MSEQSWKCLICKQTWHQPTQAPVYCNCKKHELLCSYCTEHFANRWAFLAFHGPVGCWTICRDQEQTKRRSRDWQ